MSDPNDHTPPLALSDISTTWRRVNNPQRFVMAYGSASRAYLLALLRDQDAADEVLQGVLLQVTEKGFPTHDPTAGRFRHYLKAVLRNAANRHRRPGRMSVVDADPDTMGESAEDRTWQEEWRACVLEAAWRALDRHQRTVGRGNLAHTVLRLTADHPDKGAIELAAMASRQAGQPLTAAAFRQQLHRARRTFAELIVAEVRQSLDGAGDAEVLDELAELRLLEYVRDHLPAA